MFKFNDLQDDLIIICPTSNKKILVKNLMETNPLKHVKFMTKEEVLDGTYFTYDLDSINYVSNKYGYSLDLSKEILSNLKGVKKYNEKLDKLTLIYDDLKENNFLKFNPNFKNLFTNKTIYINGYSKLDRELKSALDKLGVSYSYLEDNRNNYKPQVLKFREMKDELTFVFNNICALIKKGVSMNNIYLYNIPSEYNLLLKKFFIFHDIPFEDNEDISLYETTIYKNYLTLLDEKDFTNAYNDLKETTPYDNFDALGKIVDIVLKVNDIDTTKENKLKLLDFLAKNTILKGEHFKESIKICNNNSIITDDDYVFMLGFSLGAYPKVSKDTDFYLDSEKEFLNLNTSYILNKMSEEDLINFIKDTKNLTITLKLRVGKDVYYPSPLIEKLGLNVYDGKISNKRYSTKQSMLEVSSYIDMDNSYGIKNKWINSYKKDELLYGCFNREFKGLDKAYNGDKKLELSYSQINEYNKCPFNYFINRILKVNTFDGNFATNLGSLYHEILEASSKGEVNLDDYKLMIDKNFKTYKEKYFVKKLLPQVKDVINLNEEFLENSFFTKVYAENKYEVMIDPNSLLMGRIDKVIIDEDGKNYIVIDYKTGDFYFKKEKTKYGIDMQLPIYSLLLKETYPDYENNGMFIQNVCLDKDELNKKTKYTLDGIILEDENTYKKIDTLLGKEFDDEGNMVKTSKFVKHIKLNKDGSYSKNSKAFPKELFDELIETAKEQTKLVIEKIRAGFFPIAPVKFKGEQDTACTYCKNKDICFMKHEDFREIDLKDATFEEEDE